MSEREQARQQAFLQGLIERDQGGQLGPWLRDAPARVQRGMQVYEANAGASAERTLAASFPIVAALLGEESFAALARALWQAHPPAQGDLARFGEALPSFVADSEQLADVPYLADAARLDWLLAQAESAADAPLDPASLSLLADTEPESLRLDLAPGAALLHSRFPIVELWRAHQVSDAQGHDRFADFRVALAAGEGECALVWREAWCARVEAVSPSTARWTFSLLQGASLADALNSAGEGFEFEPWLLHALQHGLLVRARNIVNAG